MRQIVKGMSAFVFHFLFFAFREVGSEQYQYFLDIQDKLDPDWIHSDLSSVSRIECAHLCFKQESCTYFGYNVGVCHLLKDTVDEEQCTESCTNPGIKIYKLKEIKLPTTTEAIPSTTKEITTTTEVTTTTTEEPTSTTTQKPTTTTEKPTTTTEKQTTTTEKPTTTTEKPTTTTEEPTTTTEEPTTTTEKPTTTTEKPTTTTEEPTTTTEKSLTTTKEPTTTVSQTTTPPPTTTKEPTTTTQKTTTGPTTTTETPTTIGASTTTTTTNEEPFNCDPPAGAEAELKCPTENMLINALGSKSPFFGDAMSPKCYDFQENLYDATKETIYTFFSLDGGFTIKAQCEKEYDLIIKFKICVKDAHIPALTIHCSPIKDTDRIEKVFNATSEVWKDALTDCDDKSGMQAMFMSDAGDGIVTRVIFQCVLFKVNDLKDALPVEKPSGV